MSLSGNYEISEYKFIMNQDFLTNLNILKEDIHYKRDFRWIFNRFIPCDLYYDLIENLTKDEKKKFDIANIKLSIQTTSNLSFDELERLEWEMICDDNNDYNDLEDDNEELGMDLDDNLFAFKKMDKKLDKE